MSDRIHPAHTPGPWVTWADTNLVIRLHSGAARSEDLRICEVATNTRNDEGRHNATLIAAAPSMYAELVKLEQFLLGVSATDYPASDELVSIRAVLEAARGSR